MPYEWLQPVRDMVKGHDLTRLFNIYIAGVEVSQAIQHCNADEHLTDRNDRGPDNSIQLVADKPAYVRVYVRTLVSAIGNVRGTVTVERRRKGAWVNSGTLTQQFPASITAQPDLPYAQERGRLGSSLNFLLPSVEMRGRMRLRVRVEVPDSDYSDARDVQIVASLMQTLKIRGIPVRYLGPDAAGNPVDLPAPTAADFQTTAALALSLFPVSHVPDINLAGTFTWSNPLTGNITTSDGIAKCPRSWEHLLWWLGVAKAIDGNRSDCLYYALLPIGIPVGNAGGCGGGGAVGAGFNCATRSMAHELGHVLDLGHAPCSLVAGDNGDLSYPAYEPYDTPGAKRATIGEYGIDVTIPWVHPPATSRDLMSYCTPTWISPYHYGKLIEHPLLNPRWVSTPPYELPPYEQGWPPRLPIPDPGWDRRWFQDLADPPVKYFVLTGLFLNERIEVRSALRLETRTSGGALAVEGAFAELLDGSGQTLERVPVVRLPLQACGNCAPGCKCGGGGNSRSGLIQAFLPDRDDAKAVRLIWRDEEVWSRKAGRSKPTVTGVHAEIRGDELRLQWESRVADGSCVERAVRWSADGGETWEALALFLEDDEATLPIEAVYSGDILIQTIVSDGFMTAVSEPISVTVPQRGPVANILWPRSDYPLASDGVVRLWGVGVASDGRLLSGEELQWEMDGELVGTGTEVWADVRQGCCEHKVVMRARDLRWVSEAAVTFSTHDMDRE